MIRAKIDNSNFVIYWSIKGTGFGTFLFYTIGSKLYIANEYMNKKTIKSVMNKLIDQAILTEGGDNGSSTRRVSKQVKPKQKPSNRKRC